MLTKGLDVLSQNKNGFFVQVEAGKVDWAAHANDAGALVYDQLAFDDAIKVAVDFADKNEDTLVIITTDHGNANPGVFYGENASEKFKKVLSFSQSNDAMLNSIKVTDTADKVIAVIEKGTQITISKEEAAHILSYYKDLSETGVYNYKKLPYKYLGELLKKYTNIGFGDMDHSGDHVELAFYGKGQEKLIPFIKNYEIHNLLLDIALP